MSSLQSVRLLTPGPTPLPEQVRLVMAQPAIHHRKPEFKQALAEIQANLRLLFCTSQVVLPLTCSGTGAMTAAVENLFNPGEQVLVAEAGKFGERWLQIATKRGLDALHLSAPWGQSFDLAELEQILIDHPDCRGLLVQVSETSTGVMHPIREIAQICARHQVLLVADGISAVGISPLPMDEWGIDCLLTGSQKGLMVPPGLALIALSEQAWAKAATVRPGSFYFDLQRERDNCLKNQTLFTPATSLLLALREALRLLLEAGLDQVYRKQEALTAMARTGARALKLDLFAPQHYARGLTSLLLPPDLPATPIVQRLAGEFGVIITAGQEPMKERLLRIGHMGWVDWADLAAALYALAQCLPWQAQPGYLEAALNAYWQVMRTDMCTD